MNSNNMREILINALDGVNAHLNPKNVLEDLKIETAEKEISGSPYTIWQVLRHINYWQEKFISYIKDETTPQTPSAKIGWDFPASPSTESELKNEIEKFNLSVEKIKNLSEKELTEKAQKYKSGYDVIQAMASHISYHIAEIVLLRRIIGDWPPPSGGDTW